MKSYRVENELPTINIDKPHELWDWAAALKVSAERLKQAVLTVGNSSIAVRSYLEKR